MSGWYAKHAPKKLDDCVLLDDVRKKLEVYFKYPQSLPNLVLFGATGLGKTTVSRLLAEHFSKKKLRVVRDFSFLDALGMRKDQVKNEFESLSNTDTLEHLFDGGFKAKDGVLIRVEEASKAQTANVEQLVGMIEKHERQEKYSHLRFIFTTNDLMANEASFNRLWSRCDLIHFQMPERDAKGLVRTGQLYEEWIAQLEALARRIVKKERKEWRQDAFEMTIADEYKVDDIRAFIIALENNYYQCAMRSS